MTGHPLEAAINPTHTARDCDEDCRGCYRCYIQTGETACQRLCDHARTNRPADFTLCDQCLAETGDEGLERVTVQSARATYSSPAEYDEQWWCARCRERERYLADPFNQQYERARARGWED